ncbi:MAG: V-type ATPase subunit [Ruminiclostridium sp.]|nr:V-type ATPase subunit [Ruminiclostridium sp.]
MANSAVCAKCKAVYGAFLKKSDYDSLIQRTSVSAVTAYLKSVSAYRDVFAEIDEASIHRGQLEQLLNEHIFRTYIRIRRFGSGGKNSITDFYIKKCEAEQLIKLITAIASGNRQSFYLGLPSYLMDYFSFDPVEALNCENFRELAKILSRVRMYRPLVPYLEAEDPDINKCIIVINSCYLSWAFGVINRDFSKKKRETLKQFFLRKTDMDNIILCYRLKKYFNEDEERIRELMIPFHYRVKPEDIDAALSSQNPTEALIKLLADRCIPEKIGIEESFPELATTRSHYEFFRHRLALTCDETESLFSLVVLLETERTNLQKIIEGVRYGEQPSEIEKLVII